MTSTTPAVTAAPHVLVAMSAVMKEIGASGIAKGRRNKDQGYNFRGIDDVYNDLNPIMARNALLMIPTHVEAGYVEKPSKSGGILNYARLTIDWLMASAIDGSTQPMQTVGEAMDSADKASNKAQSAAMKYAALMVFMIPTEGGNDADAVTSEPVSPRPDTTPDAAPKDPPKDPPKGAQKGSVREATGATPVRSAMLTAALNAMKDCGRITDLRKWSDDNGETLKGLSDEEYQIAHAAFLKRAEQLRALDAAAKSGAVTERPPLAEAA